MPSNDPHHIADGFTYLAQPAALEPERATLLFLHGSGHNAAFWERQLAALDASVNCLALDLPGHGRSAASPCASVAEYAAAVCRFIEALQAESLVAGPVIPVGLSLGGAIVQWLLIHHPDGCQAGVIVNSGARLRVSAAIFEALENDYEGYLGMVKEMGLSPAHTDDAEISAILKRCSERDAAITTTDFRCCDQFDVMADLDRIDRPVLVMTAEQDRLTPPKYGAFLTDRIRGARQVTLPAAGHFSPLEQPTAFNAAIMDFIAALPI